MGTKVTRKNCNNNTNIQRKIANHCYKERRIDEAQPGRSWPGNEKIGQRISTPQPRTGFNVLPPFATKKRTHTNTHKLGIQKRHSASLPSSYLSGIPVWQNYLLTLIIQCGIPSHLGLDTSSRPHKNKIPKYHRW